MKFIRERYSLNLLRDRILKSSSCFTGIAVVDLLT